MIDFKPFFYGQYVVEYEKEESMKITSQITFLYFNDYEKGCNFLEKILGLEMVFDPGWAKVFRTVGDAYLGAVVKNEPLEEGDTRTLISLTVENVEAYYRDFKDKVDDISEIKYFDFGLRSFFFKGPEGYDFEIQEFLEEDLKQLF